MNFKVGDRVKPVCGTAVEGISGTAVEGIIGIIANCPLKSVGVRCNKYLVHFYKNGQVYNRCMFGYELEKIEDEQPAKEKIKSIVFASHFRSPRDLIWETDLKIQEGDFLLVETKFGKRIVRANSGVENATERVVKAITISPLRKVIAILNLTEEQKTALCYETL